MPPPPYSTVHCRRATVRGEELAPLSGRRPWVSAPITEIEYDPLYIDGSTVTDSAEVTAPLVTVTDEGFGQDGRGEVSPVTVQVKLIVLKKPFRGMIVIVEVATLPVVSEDGIRGVSVRT